MGDEAVKEIAMALRTNKRLHTIYMARNNISDSGAQDLAKMLEINETLTILDLRETTITKKGQKFLTKAIRAMPKRFDLSLSLDDEGKPKQ
eukprot:NODE_2865_length_440_cov_288.107256_g2843_i0.p2 GENE.NODE_2865_length_440_cov_288.107256_g2843_i0~~NODE_2865_length_440_cov_288.107256_g2843_i0.p2  ORF type:complete len:102 (-),score=37.96 NODE_2865_length_440_cov_288.107256_g2843_i0:134-406(-)